MMKFRFVKMVVPGVGESVELVGGNVHHHRCFENNLDLSSKIEGLSVCLCVCT